MVYYARWVMCSEVHDEYVVLCRVCDVVYVMGGMSVSRVWSVV